MKKERRDFLRITTVGATGLALTRATPARAAWPSTGTMEINPAISNMRVVGLVDPKMMKSTPSSSGFAAQNAAVDWPRTQANMDAMAVALTQKGSADEAWKTIFRSSRPWADTVVAVKVNGGKAENTARLAVLQKFSNLFVDWGLQPKNFIVYDGHSPAHNIFASSFSTTDKSKVLGVVSAPSTQSGDLLGGWKDGKLGNGSTRRCAAKLVDGSVDILINLANNKRHDFFGKCTLCMKNHYGTWEPDPQHTDLNNLIFNMNKGDPIIGGDPPRQQLCFVDSMFSSPGVFDLPDKMPCFFVMGTFAPAVDYLTVKKVREETLKLTHDAATINSYVTAWGYKTSDPQWILVEPGAAVPDAGAPGTGGTGAGGGGTSGENAGGASGTGGASTSGAGDSGGAGGSSTRATGGAGGRRSSGGAGGATGQASGGTTGAGGTSAAGGSSGSGGTTASAGSSGSGGTSASGGSSGSGGSASSGGTTASSATGSGGAPPSGGSSTSEAGGDLGCACNVGSPRVNVRGWGVALALGAFVAGQVRKLVARRARVTPAVPEQASEDAQPTPPVARGSDNTP